mmetsp:Transcript_9019/g.23355  ORF Transcript_9019/g.23355 Transcript_9019/m.23355 type:complete len:230 (-) Transcript_9019:286-975(-)
MFWGCRDNCQNRQEVEEEDTILFEPSQAQRGQQGWLSSLIPEEQVWSRSRPKRERVLVHVYDLGQSYLTQGLNSVTRTYGAFHTGVEVYGKEWLFGMAGGDTSGIAWHEPKQCRDHTFRETLSMGCTPYSEVEVLSIIEELKCEWRGCSYDMLTRNCHHFSDAFCRRLQVASLPTWVNTLAGTGHATYEFLESGDSGYDGGEALFKLLDNVWSNMYGVWSSPPPREPVR